MTNNTHAFLHGTATTVTGTWLDVDDAPTCKTRKCERLCNNSAISFDDIRKQECSQCSIERTRRHRVLTEENSHLLGAARFKYAPIIVANNDLKYHINKTRAAKYARDTHQPILWCAADDHAMADDIIHDPKLRQRKLKWLQ